MADSYQQQLTTLYDKLMTLNSHLLQLCLNSRMNTIQESIRYKLDTLVGDISNDEAQIEQIQLDLTDAINELRAL